VITVAGPAANFILAVLLFAGLLLAMGEYVLPTRIASVTPTARPRPRASGRATSSSGRRPEIRQFQRPAGGSSRARRRPMSFVVRRGETESL
jgi:regulator of sigma E protease